MNWNQRAPVRVIVKIMLKGEPCSGQRRHGRWVEFDQTSTCVRDPDQICDAVAESKLLSPGCHPADPLPRLGLSAHRGRGFDGHDASREPVSKVDGEPTDTGTDVHDEALRSHKRGSSARRHSAAASGRSSRPRL